MESTEDQDRWPLTDADRQEVVDKVLALVHGDDERISLAAIRCLLEMERQNQRDDHNGELEAKARGRLLGLLHQAGVRRDQ